MRQYYRMFRSQVLQRVIPRSRIAYDSARPVEVDGYLSMTAGIGESARLCAGALAVDGIPLRLADVSTHPEEKRDVEWDAPAEASSFPGSRILHLNPPMLPRGIARIGLGNFGKTFNIGYWAWELEVIPDEWKRALRYMNAVFVPSEFSRKAISRHTDIPVVVVPHPVSERPAAPGMREKFSIPADAFLVSTIFSAGSSINRKNPQAVLAAFRDFRRDHPRAHLLMKANGNPDRDAGLRALIAAAGEIGNVRVITDLMPSSYVNGIIAASNAYISLHRSEGFGLTVAEAILAKTPVISTNWSGTVDFCDPENVWNTSFKLIPVIDDHPEFAGLDAVWADADASHAASQLREIVADPDAATRRAAKAQQYLFGYLAEHTYGKALARLDEGHGRKAA